MEPENENQERLQAVKVTNFSFSYPRHNGEIPVRALDNLSFQLGYGKRCLLIGANGAGKSTLLRVLSGKHLHEKEAVQVLGNPAFFQTLGESGVAYLGNNWTRTVGYTGHNIPYQADIKACDMMKSLQDDFPERRDKLYKMLEIDPDWRMYQVSDGQRRRVQLMLGLLRPFQLLLVDEMTVDLDILARRGFLEYLKQETEERNATVIYATHILDGIHDWPTDLIFAEEGKVVKEVQLEDLKASVGFTSLYDTVVKFLLEVRARKEKKIQVGSSTSGKSTKSTRSSISNKGEATRSNRFGASRMNAYR